MRQMLREHEVRVKLLSADVVRRRIFSVDRIAREQRSVMPRFLVQPREAEVGLDRPSIKPVIDDTAAVVTARVAYNISALTR